jgi:hypothetical protein
VLRRRDEGAAPDGSLANGFKPSKLVSGEFADCCAALLTTPKSLMLFETLINVVHQASPAASIAFNTQPHDTADAAARWLKAG